MSRTPELTFASTLFQHAKNTTPVTINPTWTDLVRELEINRNHWFRNYRIDGKEIDFANLDLVKILQSLGCEVGLPRPFKTGSKWRCHCPWATEHTDGLDDDSGTIFHTPGNWPVFKCSHSGHTHLGLRDICEFAWGVPS